MSDLLTDVELFAVAQGIASGAVFTDRHIRKGDEDQIGLIFMPILFASDDDITKLEKDAGLMYEWVSTAHSHVDGYPCFTSMQYVNEDQAKQISDYVDEIFALRERLTGEGVPSGEET